MNTFDIVIAVFLVFGFIRGLMKGLFVEVASLVALVAGIYGAIHFSFFTASLLGNYVTWDDNIITIAAFAITFALIVLVIALLGKFLTKLADFAALGMLNKILGGVFGLLKFGLIFSVVLLIFQKLNSNLPFISSSQTSDSVLYEPVKNLAPTLFPNFLTVVEDNVSSEISEE